MRKKTFHMLQHTGDVPEFDDTYDYFHRLIFSYDQVNKKIKIILK